MCRFHCEFVHGCSIKPGFHKMQKDVDNKHLALGKIPHTRRYLASLYSFLVCCLCLCLGASENVKNIKMCQISGNRFNLYSMIFINALKMFSKHIKTHEKSREMLKALEPAVCNVTFLWRLNIIQMATLNIEIFQQLISSAQKQKKKRILYTKQWGSPAHCRTCCLSAVVICFVVLLEEVWGIYDCFFKLRHTLAQSINCGNTRRNQKVFKNAP